MTSVAECCHPLTTSGSRLIKLALVFPDEELTNQILGTELPVIPRTLLIIVIRFRFCLLFRNLKVAEDGNKNPEFRSCVKVDVAVLGSPPLIVQTVSVDVK